jgi:hypothetical protein
MASIFVDFFQLPHLISSRASQTLCADLSIRTVVLLARSIAPSLHHGHEGVLVMHARATDK